MPGIRHVAKFYVFGMLISPIFNLRVLLPALFSITLLTLPAATHAACPYCPQSPDVTLSQKFAESDAACIAEFLEARNGKELSMQTTKFRIREMLKPSEKYKIDDVIEMPIGVTAKSGDLYLLMGQFKGGEMEWSLPIESDDVSREYVRQAPSPELRPVEKRLEYFVKFLDFSNPLISNDAFSEFAQADFKDVESLIANISKEKLRGKVRKWLEENKPQMVARRAFYGLLLGLCGNDDDAKFLEATLLAPIPRDKNRIGIDGLMGGYLLLRGNNGLKLLMDKKLDALPTMLDPDDPRIPDANGLLLTIVVMWDNRRGQFDEELLRSSMRKFLDRPEFAETAVIDLARWKDWKSLDRLIAGYGRDPWDIRSAKEKVVAFALSCKKDAKANPKGPAAAYVKKADDFLNELDPDFVDSVKRSAGGPIPVPESKQATKKGSDGSQ